MTNRERTAVVFFAVGVVATLVAAYSYDGIRGVWAAGGLLALAFGVLLAVDDPEPPAPTPLEGSSSDGPA